jgi:hypothetical protein
MTAGGKSSFKFAHWTEPVTSVAACQFARWSESVTSVAAASIFID